MVVTLKEKVQELCFGKKVLVSTALKVVPEVCYDQYRTPSVDYTQILSAPWVNAIDGSIVSLQEVVSYE